MATIFLWAFCDLYKLLSSVNSDINFSWKIYSTRGLIKTKSHTKVLSECKSKSTFSILASLQSVSILGNESPIDFNITARNDSENRDWGSRYRSFSSRVAHCSAYEVKQYPSSLMIWIDGGVDDAMAWAKEFLSAASSIKILGGISKKNEVIDAPGLLAPNPWLYEKLKTNWPTIYETYITTVSSLDSEELTALSSYSQSAKGLLYLSIDDAAIAPKILTVKRYGDIGAANRVFGKRAPVG